MLLIGRLNFDHFSSTSLSCRGAEEVFYKAMQSICNRWQLTGQQWKQNSCLTLPSILFPHLNKCASVDNHSPLSLGLVQIDMRSLLHMRSSTTLQKLMIYKMHQYWWYMLCFNVLISVGNCIFFWIFVPFTNSDYKRDDCIAMTLLLMKHFQKKDIVAISRHK